MSETITNIVTDTFPPVLRLLETSCVDNYFNQLHVRSVMTFNMCSKYNTTNASFKCTRHNLLQHLGLTM
jgi:hypothetical protein